MNLSYSLIRSWQTCQFRTKLSYLDRVEEPPRINTDLGHLIHKGCEVASYGALLEPAMRGLAPKFEQYWLDQGIDGTARTDLCVDTVARWLEWAKVGTKFYVLDDPRDSTRYATECRFEFPLDPPIGIFNKVVIKPDALTKRKFGDIWVSTIHDYKITTNDKKMNQPTVVDQDIQLPLYSWVLHHLGEEYYAGCFHYIKPAWPEFPALAKRGTRLSRKPIKTDWPTYRRAIVEAGFNPKDYADVEKRLVDQERNPFFAEYITHFGWPYVRGLWENVITPIALEMSDAFEGRRRFARTWDQFPCSNWCSHREQCYLGLLGISDMEVYNQ